MTVRKITIEELPKIEPLAQSHFNLSKLKGRFNKTHFLKQLENFMTIDYGCVFVLEKDGEFVGGLVGIFVPDLYTGEKNSAVMAWFVHPAARGNGLKLIQAFEEESFKRNCTRCYSGHLSNINPDFMSKLYSRLDFTVHEIIYRKELVQ